MMTSALADIDPFVLPCWRWEVAEQICDDPTATAQPDEAIIQDAVDYLRSGDETRFPTIHAARQLYETDGLDRGEIEARILAGQSDDEIAERCGVSPQLVSVYETLFFAVRRHLGATGWVLARTVGEARFRGFRNDELRQLWAWCALAGGAFVVDEVVDAYHRVMRHDDEPTLSVYLREGADVRLGLQAYIAGLVIPCTDTGHKWNFEFGVRLLEAEAITDPERSRHAVEQLRRDVISIARKALAGEPLGDPPVRKRSTKRASHSQLDRPTTTRTVQDRVPPRCLPGSAQPSLPARRDPWNLT